MLGQIVEITTEGTRLSLARGFLNVETQDGVKGQVPLDDIEAVIASTPAITYSNQLLAALAERGAPVVICTRHFTPSAMLLPVDGHHNQGLRFEAQAAAGLPVKKRAWAELVTAKISAQSAVLDELGKDGNKLKVLASRVRSGDPENIEAQAAQAYWPALFGPGFRRDRTRDDVNVFLNYGYTVLRAAAARAVVAAGLHPSLGLHHKSAGDALKLADDLMEPFRPAVDLIAYEIHREAQEALTPPLKRRLAGVLHADYATEPGVSTLSNAMTRLAQSLAQIFLKERKALLLPISKIPLTEQDAAQLSDGGQI